MEVARTIGDVRRVMHGWRADAARSGLVLTMGALHPGHLALVERSRASCDRTMATLFVNPLQFGPSEDFALYPRTEARDLEQLGAGRCDAVFVPSVQELYPEGVPMPQSFRTSVQVAGMSERLCGEFRPGHFAGVTTVVMKFFMIVMPDVAFFGEKDFQQLQIIRRMVLDLNVPIEIVGVPTVREADGLAMSSRNQYLSAGERRTAPVLYLTLNQARSDLLAESNVETVLKRARRTLVESGFTSVDYVSLVASADLEPLHEVRPGARLVAAARLGRTRLIDNIPI